MKNKIIKKLSINTAITSGVLLTGYILCDNPILSKQTAILSTVFATSTAVYVKKIKENSKKY